MRNERRLRTAAILLCGLLAAAQGTHAEEADKPMLELISIPSYGVRDVIRGRVHTTADAETFAVTGFVQIEEGGTQWGPKPTLVEPTVPVEADGSFELNFITGGTDENATTITVYLIPFAYRPIEDWAATEEHAFDKLVIQRTENGNVTVLPREGKWAAGEASGPSAAITGLFGNGSRIALCYSPYTNGQDPAEGDPIPAEQMGRQLELLKPYADTIRTFGASGTMYKLYRTAKETYGYRIIAGAWIEAGYTDAQIRGELDALVNIAKNGWCDMAVVGSECLYRGDFTQEQLAGYLRYVREAIGNPAVPVATSDTAAAWLAADGIADDSDAILATCYPFFDGVSVEDAAETLVDTYRKLAVKYPDKTVILSETGWPSDGSAEGCAVPSVENAGTYFADVYEWAKTSGVDVVYFSAFDEAWKVEGSDGDIGGHWGHFTANGDIKAGYREVYERIAAGAE